MYTQEEEDSDGYKIKILKQAIKNYGIEKAMGMFAKDDVDEAVEENDLVEVIW